MNAGWNVEVACLHREKGEGSFREVWQQNGGQYLCAIVRLTLRSLQCCADLIAIGTYFLEV